MLLTAAALTWDRKLIPALPGTPQTCAARLAHRACSSARRTRTRTSQDKQCPCQERSYDTGKQTEFSYSQVFLCTSCATAGHTPRPDGAFMSLTLISPCAHQCGLQIVPSRCPSVRPAVCAVQVPIDADSALQSGESPGLYGCSAHDASWSLGIFWMRLPIRAAPMAPHGSPRGLGALEPGSVRVEIRNLCGLKNP